MRIDVQKYLFVGNHNERDRFFAKAQEAGIIHFIDKEEKRFEEIPEEISQLTHAIKVLRGLPPTDQEEGEGSADPIRIAKEILTLREQVVRLEEEKRVIGLEKARVAVFGDFSLEDIAYIEKKTGRHLQFYFATKKAAEMLEEAEGLIYVGSDHNLCYFMGINKEPTQYPKMIEMKIERPLGTLLKRGEEVEKEWHQLEAELKEYAKYNEALHRAMVSALNHHDLLYTKEWVDFAVEGKIFVVEGWVAQTKERQLRELLSQGTVYCEEIAVEEEDVIPTCLENENLARVGEDLVHIYDTPSDTDRDPSVWVLCFFSLFFAMIINDAGYGFLFLAIALYARYKAKKVTRVGKRFFQLVTILAVSTVAWGVLSHSFFGIELASDNPLRSFSLIHWLSEKKAAFHFAAKDATYQEWAAALPAVKEAANASEFLSISDVNNKFADNVMLELALLVGVVHLSFSLLRYLDRSWAGIGWVAFMAGCYLYFPSYLDATSILQYVFGVDRGFAAMEGIYFISGGLGIAVLLSFIQNRWMGILEITQVIQVFGDALSYLRLYALGLAGAMVSSTVNGMAASAAGVLGLLIILVGHTINIAISIMGGVIHGLRLNFLEWYHYSFDGGGRLFRPLRKREIE